jgi:WD40 repeat protein
MEIFPLQIYFSALIFTPLRSRIRHLYVRQAPRWITTHSAPKNEWGACIQTLDMHSDRVISVAFSHDSALVTSSSDDKTVKIWETYSGTCLRTLEGHSNAVNSVMFSRNSVLIIPASMDKTIRVWETSSGECLRVLRGHEKPVICAVFGHDSSSLHLHHSTQLSRYGS